MPRSKEGKLSKGKLGGAFYTVWLAFDDRRWDSDIEVRTGLHTVKMQANSVIEQLNNFYLRDRRVKVGIGVVIARNQPLLRER